MPRPRSGHTWDACGNCKSSSQTVCKLKHSQTNRFITTKASICADLGVCWQVLCATAGMHAAAAVVYLLPAVAPSHVRCRLDLDIAGTCNGRNLQCRTAVHLNTHLPSRQSARSRVCRLQKGLHTAIQVHSYRRNNSWSGVADALLHIKAGCNAATSMLCLLFTSRQPCWQHAAAHGPCSTTKLLRLCPAAAKLD